MREWLKGIDRTNAMVAAGVWLLSLIVYLQTMAPTLTFWDCGEFIAVSYILGIPHPPGTPLYVLVGKLFTMNPLISEPSARINFLSVLSSSFTTLFAYLCGVRVIRYWIAEKQDSLTRMILYGGAAAGALFFAWSKTHWNNSTEAEVYGLSMLMFMAAIWLAFRYFESGDQSTADKMMLAVVYIAYLGIGVHMTTFLVLPILTLFFILKKDTPVRYWFIASTLIMVELYLIFALSSRRGEISFSLPIFVVFVIYLLYLMSIEKLNKLHLYISGAFLVASVPLGGAIISLVRSGSEASSSTTLNIIGYAGALALVGMGIWSLVTYMAQRGNRSEAKDSTLLVGAIFVAVAVVLALLSIVGVQGYGPFLFISVVLIAGTGLILWNYIRWPIFVAIVGSSLIILGIYPFVWGTLGAAVVVLVLGLMFRLQGWRTALLILAVAVAGFSVQLFIPIRSAQHPYINENNPSQSLAQTIGFLERKQYGSESMIERMFKRRAEWENQFGTWRRMGFWGFFQEQYGINGRTFFIAFVLGVFGLWEAIRRRSELGLALTLLIIISSVGLVLYMNFADGQRQHPVTGDDYIEVRDRDYFFTPAYVLFGIAIGLGISALIHFVREALAKLSSPIRSVATYGMLILLAMPTYALSRNYFECDRSRNWIAHDYAKSLLSSADRDAAFFTYGDNDTFPLWCLQEAYGFRKDVKIVNLSLANTKWYIKQVQDYMKLDLGMTESQIDAMRPYRTQDGRVFHLNNQVVDAIIDHNRDRVPVNFSITVANDGRKMDGVPADPYLTLTGLSWRLGAAGGGPKTSVEEALSFFFDTTRYQMRGLRDSSIFKDANQIRLPANYSNSMMMVADTLRRAQRHADAIRLLEYGHRTLPYDEQLVNYLAGLYTDLGRVEDLKRLMEDPSIKDSRWMTVLLGRQYRENRRFMDAEATLNPLFLKDPSFRAVFEELTTLYSETENYSALKTTLDIWIQAHPSDTAMANIRRELDNFIANQKRSDTAK